jgi:hypothetical protein
MNNNSTVKAQCSPEIEGGQRWQRMITLKQDNQRPHPKTHTHLMFGSCSVIWGGTTFYPVGYQSRVGPAGLLHSNADSPTRSDHTSRLARSQIVMWKGGRFNNERKVTRPPA